MANTDGLIKLDQAVYSYLNETGEGVENFNRYKQIVIEGYTDMNIHVTNTFEQFISEVNSVNQIALPSDYIDWVGVFLEVNGKYWPLDFNDSIVLPKTDGCASGFYFSDHLLPPDRIGYGYTVRRYNAGGSFAVKDRVIRFSGDFKGKSVYILYISSGVRKGADTFINRAYLPVLKAYLNWIVTIRDKTSPPFRVQNSEYLYGLELQKLDVLQNGFSAHDFLSAVRDGYNLGVKR